MTDPTDPTRGGWPARRSAVEREVRRLLAEADARILQEHGSADDLDDLVRWSAMHTALGD